MEKKRLKISSVREIENSLTDEEIDKEKKEIKKIITDFLDLINQAGYYADYDTQREAEQICLYYDMDEEFVWEY